MANVAEIKVTVDVPNQAALDLLSLMADELSLCYGHLDRIASTIGANPYARNTELLAEFERFRSACRVEGAQ